MPYVSYAELLREQNRFDEALRFGEQGIALCLLWQPMASMDGYIALARLEAGRGNWDAAFERVERALDVARNTDILIDDSFVALQYARLYLLRGDLTPASRWMKYNDPPELNQAFFVMREIAELVNLRFQILRERDRPARENELAEQISALIPEIERRERATTLIGALTLRAYAYHFAGKHAEAAQSLARALKRGEACGYVRAFADEGGLLSRLFERYRAELRDSSAYIESLLPLMGAPPKPAPRPEELIPLTRRELDILNLMADGKSNAEIARELTLAITTVKKHVANVLNKLGAANRTQAALIGKERGWIKRNV
jgi:LuxR family maltose regulon positive regulatory protein